jgi:hypothetical protein
MEGTFEPTGIKSSISDDVTYNKTASQMRVVFTNKSKYEYDNISQEEVDSVKDAESSGKRLKEIFKGKPYRRVME